MSLPEERREDAITRESGKNPRAINQTLSSGKDRGRKARSDRLVVVFYEFTVQILRETELFSPLLTYFPIWYVCSRTTRSWFYLEVASPTGQLGRSVFIAGIENRDTMLLAVRFVCFLLSFFILPLVLFYFRVMRSKRRYRMFSVWLPLQRVGINWLFYSSFLFYIVMEFLCGIML